jgi:hypothetical protein
MCDCLSVLFFCDRLSRGREEKDRAGSAAEHTALMLHILIMESQPNCWVELTFMLLSRSFYRYFVIFFSRQSIQTYTALLASTFCNKFVFTGLLCLSEFKYLGVYISMAFFQSMYGRVA